MLQATVRIQLLNTRPRWALESNPLASALCLGTCKTAVETQIKTTIDNPLQQANSRSCEGGFQARTADVTASTSIGSATTHFVRRTCSDWYWVKPSAPTHANWG